MRILYGAVGEGLGHATRSRVVAAHLLEQGHEVKMAASGRAYPYLQEHLPDVEEIWGTSLRPRARHRQRLEDADHERARRRARRPC